MPGPRRTEGGNPRENCGESPEAEEDKQDASGNVADGAYNRRMRSPSEDVGDNTPGPSEDLWAQVSARQLWEPHTVAGIHAAGVAVEGQSERGT